ncbi:conserved hypothetical protein [Lodderomyces elongisporus NRRL YB-4239]|uniref:GTPase-activating protein GYP5 n=1 Tax=Lodderomyces elongisporus (strain ATCC 11503 / CBS 2605 / JCM 1781 / NBRC 1676 / NRRL YB-4239) TaxID=379508 RepID=A5DY91_LODEL|nr:conserved hypothetical protein [Lodderomyces elongisporus NRRL YB-4239]
MDNDTKDDVETKDEVFEDTIEGHESLPTQAEIEEPQTSQVLLPSRDPIQTCLQLNLLSIPLSQTSKSANDTANEPEFLQKISTVLTSYDKSTSNYLLQSKHNILSLKFKDKDSVTQRTLEDGALNIKNTFSNIKNIVGGMSQVNSPYKIDWDFWTWVVDDYDYIVNNKLDQLNELIAQGIPSEIRGIIWQIVTKSKDSNLEDLYRSLKHESSIHEKAIKRDLTRTSFFTNIDAVNKADELYNVIKAYSLYDPDVGYTQGMIFIAVPLIMNMHESECFCLLVLLMKEYQLRELFCPEMKGLHLLLYQFDCLLAKNVPTLYNHLVKQGIKSSMYASQWFLTFFAYKFPLDIVLRIYDVIITEGMESILKFAVNLMVQNEASLLALSFDKLLEFLKDKLFNVYVNPAFIKNTKHDSKVLSPTKFSAILTRRVSHTSSAGSIPSPTSSNKKNGETNHHSFSNSNTITSPTSTTTFSSSSSPSSSSSSPSSYYQLDEFVQDAMKINIDPMDLTKFENRFNQCFEEEKAKLLDIKQVKIENGKLRHELKQLEFEYANLERDHVDLMQGLVDLKVTLPEVLSANEESRAKINKLEQEIKELELKTESSDQHDVPASIEEKIKELLLVNAEEVELTANLEDELATLVEEEYQLDQELKKHNQGWFKWSS